MRYFRQLSTGHGFTLVELSVVLVILGLIVGGILGGQNLVKASKMRSVTSDANTYLTAISQFRSQYNYLPGDLPTATNYWSGSAAGNGDGLISQSTNEEFRVWDHLNLAGLLEQSYTGVAGGGGASDSIPGTNVPKGRLENSGFSFYYADMTATTKVYTATLGNMLTFGGTVAASEPTTAILTPEDAYSIDIKMDDGLPGSGKWIANGTGGGNFGTTTACTTATSGTDYTGAYRLNNTAVSCSFFIMSGF